MTYSQFPKTTWVYSPQSESLRLLQVAYNIRNDFFRSNGFFILPTLVKGTPNCIVFPDFKWYTIARFWKKVALTSEQLQDQHDPVIHSITSFVSPTEPHMETIRKGWKLIEQSFFKVLFDMYPQSRYMKTLEIRPTRYGSMVTAYSRWMKKESGLCVLYLRCDADISYIAEGILLDLFHRFWHKAYSWEQIEGMIDLILRYSKLTIVFPHHKGTPISLNFKQQGIYAHQSSLYLEKLGIGKTPVFSIAENTVYKNGKPITILFTPQEKSLMMLLIQKQGNTANYDEIAETLWKKESYERYSEYAIVKLVERVRKKLETAGIQPQVIQAVKGKGYLLQ